MVYQLVSIANTVRAIIRNAELDYIIVDDGNVVDLLADNLPGDISISDIRSAIAVAGFAARFPKATAKRRTA